MGKETSVVMLVGRTPSGFNRWLKENGMKEIAPDRLADMVSESVDAVLNGDKEKVQRIFEELKEAVNCPKEKEIQLKAEWYMLLRTMVAFASLLKQFVEGVKKGK